MPGRQRFTRAPTVLARSRWSSVSRRSFSRPHDTKLGPSNPIGLQLTSRSVAAGEEQSSMAKTPDKSSNAHGWATPTRASEGLAVCHQRRNPSITISGARVSFFYDIFTTCHSIPSFEKLNTGLNSPGQQFQPIIPELCMIENFTNIKSPGGSHDGQAEQ